MKEVNRFLVIVLFVFVFNFGQVEASSNPQRISGSDRVETSIEISKVAFKTSKVVILAGYDGQVDSLSGTMLANFKNAPIILTRKDKIDQSVLDQIKSLGAKEIYILGGENVISKKVESSLSSYKVTRINGKRREETAINIAKEVIGKNIDEVFLTLGYNEYADALAIGPISGKQRVPIFLTTTTELPKDTKDALKQFKVKKATIIGGETVVNKSVENELSSMGIKVERVSGRNRIDTALSIAKKYSGNPDSIVIANGYTHHLLFYLI